MKVCVGWVSLPVRAALTLVMVSLCNFRLRPSARRPLSHQLPVVTVSLVLDHRANKPTRIFLLGSLQTRQSRPSKCLLQLYTYYLTNQTL